MYFPPDMQVLYDAGVVASGTDSDALYRQWVENMREYSQQIDAPGSSTYHFWVVIRMVAKNYSERLTYHETLPMMIPASGTGELVGFAKTKEELDDLITPQPNKKTGEFGEADRRKREYVYLTYKARIRGEEAWRKFLDFLGTHDMLEKDG